MNNNKITTDELGICDHYDQPHKRNSVKQAPCRNWRTLAKTEIEVEVNTSTDNLRTNQYEVERNYVDSTLLDRNDFDK